MKKENKTHLPTAEELSQNEVIEDSVVFYCSWFICLLQQGAKRFLQGTIALLAYAFFGIQPSTMGLPRPLEAIINTFIPVIDSNRRNRKNGEKGGQYGKMGGRPQKNPSGVRGNNPTDTVTVTETDTDNVSVSGMVTAPVTDQNSTPPHTDSSFFLEEFFFRNVRHPEKQAEKFANHYQATGWRLSGGEYAATDEQRLALAKRWEIRDGSIGRFKDEDIHMWYDLYVIAPRNIRPLMLDQDIRIFKNTKAIIHSPKQVLDWIRINAEVTKPIISRWAANLAINCIPYEPKHIA